MSPVVSSRRKVKDLRFTLASLPSLLFPGGHLSANADPFVGFSFGSINQSNQTMTLAYDFTTTPAGPIKPDPGSSSELGSGMGSNALRPGPTEDIQCMESMAK